MPSGLPRPLTVPAAILLLILGVPATLAAQGARASSSVFARGKSLAEWVEQSAHYIPELRREAIKAIGSLGPAARPALPVLIRATRDENQEVRFWAVDGLRRMGRDARDAAPALVTVLGDDVRPVQEAARSALEAIGPVTVPLLVPLLRNPDPWLRANAAEALGVIGSPKSRAVPEIARLLSDDSLWVRASAAWSLGHFGPEARKTVGPLTIALAEELRRDPVLAAADTRVRVANLVFALGRLGKSAAQAVPVMISVIYDGDDSLRTIAAEGLAGIGSKAAEPLGRVVREGPMPVRLQATRALRLMGQDGRRAVPDLVKVLESTDELEGGHALVIATAEALGAMGKAAKPALKALERQRRQSASPDVVAALDRAIRKIHFGA
jgi:HEAT repeat protein